MILKVIDTGTDIMCLISYKESGKISFKYPVWFFRFNISKVFDTWSAATRSNIRNK